MTIRKKCDKRVKFNSQSPVPGTRILGFFVNFEGVVEYREGNK